VWCRGEVWGRGKCDIGEKSYVGEKRGVGEKNGGHVLQESVECRREGVEKRGMIQSACPPLLKHDRSGKKTNSQSGKTFLS
jgi:hypothetical protein